MNCSILDYSCQSVWGEHTLDYWNALQAGKTPEHYHAAAKTPFTRKFLNALRDLRTRTTLAPDHRLGVIFASTKGEIEEYIWNQDSYQAHQNQDGLTPVLQSFLKAAEISPALSLCVSNACASSLSALFLGQRWIAQGRVDQVLVLAADQIGPFIEQGFQCLKALSVSTPRPFSKDRDGLRLGEAAALMLIGKPNGSSPLTLGRIGIDAEGYAVTRPSPSGTSLKRAHLALKNIPLPDLIIAHGTGTKINDAAEDQAFFDLYQCQVPITGAKWAIGHTLGASGLMDLIAAAEMLRHQKSFSLATTFEIDPEFRCSYLTQGMMINVPLRNILVSSLGFGGIHALTLVSMTAKTDEGNP